MKLTKLFLAMLLVGGLSLSYGCDDDTDAEDAMEDARDNVNDAADDAGDAMDDAADDAADAVDDATDD
jgi:hypothetical protein